MGQHNLQIRVVVDDVFYRFQDSPGHAIFVLHDAGCEHIKAVSKTGGSRPNLGVLLGKSRNVLHNDRSVLCLNYCLPGHNHNISRFLYKFLRIICYD